VTWLYPSETESLVISHEWEEVSSRISRALDTPFTVNDMTLHLAGWIKDFQFELTVKMRRIQFFNPRVRGTIEATSKGSLLFITYSYFPGTKVLLTFWSVVLPLLSILFFIESGNALYPAGCFLLVIFIHVMARANFAMHMKLTRKILHELLS
jgi:hypothetical protein